MVIQHGVSLDQVWELTWQQIRLATVDNKHEFRYLTLATCHQHKPFQRTVVLRAVQNLSLFVFTDLRSDKVTHLKKNNSSSLLFYSHQSKFQCRINSISSIHSNDDIAGKYMQQVRGNARLSYSSNLQPGQAIENPETAYNWNDTLNFCVLKFDPFEIEILQLIDHKHLRARYILADDKWQGKWLQP